MLRDVEARVISNTRLSADYNVIALAAPEIAETTRPGQFVMVKSGRSGDPLLRRPFSVFEVLRSNNRIEGLTLLSKRIGVTTRMLFDAVEGDTIACLGPLGRPFDVIDPPAEAWMVAGGVGLAPFATLGEALLARGTKTTLFYGARTGAELFYLDWFKSRSISVVLATEDGSIGDRARITVPLERELKNREPRIPEPGSRIPEIMIYACGPEPMLEAVARIAAKFDRPSQVSVERTMGCGMGGCYSCVIPVLEDGGPDNARPTHHYVRSCIAGHVICGEDILWDWSRA
jgi:dihydroorotate dehydrogenase electron transfer subunit